MRVEALFGAVFVVGCSGPSPVEDVERVSEPLEECASEWVEGVDVFDGQGSVDWPSVKAAGVAFAFVKATQGTYDTQATFASSWQGARAAGVVRGAYHFFDPTEDGAAQAAHFLAVVGALEAGDLPAMLDLECPDGDADCVSEGRSGAEDAVVIRGRVDAFLGAVEQATGVRPVVYTFPAYFAGSGVDASGLEVYPLFVANVGPGGMPASGGCLDVPAPWKAAAFWQYAWTGAVDGIAGEVDRDRYLGDAAGLALLTVPAGLVARAGCR